MMAPPSSPAATPAATPRWAWAGAVAETARVATAARAINVFLMASPFLSSKDSGQSSLSRRKFHILLE
jgi:hypothetical protein